MTLQEYLDKKYTKQEQKNLTELYCSINYITKLNVNQLNKIKLFLE